MKDLPFYIPVVVTNSNLEISLCHLADYVKELKVRTARAARLLFLIRPIRLFFSGVVVVFAVVLALRLVLI